MAKKSGGGGGFGKLLLGFLLGVVAVAAGAFAYLKIGNLPVAVTDAAFPFEKELVKVPMRSRIEREQKEPPFGTSEDVFEGGAKVYACSVRPVMVPRGMTSDMRNICILQRPNSGRSMHAEMLSG